jgi:phage recombination protein Bet
MTTQQAQALAKTDKAADLVPEKKIGLVAKFADRMGVDADKMLNTLKATCFKTDKPITNEQMMALLVVADQYNLNPFTREIFAYPDKGGIVPVVGVDGWSRIINERPELNGIEFAYSEGTTNHKNKLVYEYIDCIIHRTDRQKPIIVREYFDEVVRGGSYTTPWDSHPKRMHRHKALIQCARIAFGFAGIYDEDEAARISEAKSAEPDAKKEGQDTLNQLNKVKQPDAPIIDAEFTETADPSPESENQPSNESLQKAKVCEECNGKGCLENETGIGPCVCQQ